MAKRKRTNNDRQNIHRKLKIEQHGPPPPEGSGPPPTKGSGPPPPEGSRHHHQKVQGLLHQKVQGLHHLKDHDHHQRKINVKEVNDIIIYNYSLLLRSIRVFMDLKNDIHLSL